MGTTTRDLEADAYKAEQHRQWDATAGELRAWWPVFEGFMAPVTHAMLGHAGLQAGAQVVDVAWGSGEAALTVARLVGPQGQVVATDLSAAMLAVAAERAEALGLDNLAFAEMDAEEPAFPPGSFDAVMWRLGLMFLPHLATALDRLGGLLVPDGRIVAAVWGSQEANPWLDLALRTVVEFLELPPPPAEASWLFGLRGAGVFEEALSGAGLEDVHLTVVALHCEWPSVDAYTAFHASSPLRRLVAGSEPARRAQAWREVTAAATRRWGNGPLQLGGEVVVVSGRRQPNHVAGPASHRVLPSRQKGRSVLPRESRLANHPWPPAGDGQGAPSGGRKPHGANDHLPSPPPQPHGGKPGHDSTEGAGEVSLEAEKSVLQGPAGTDTMGRLATRLGPLQRWILARLMHEHEAGQPPQWISVGELATEHVGGSPSRHHVQSIRNACVRLARIGLVETSQRWLEREKQQHALTDLRRQNTTRRRHLCIRLRSPGSVTRFSGCAEVGH